MLLSLIANTVVAVELSTDGTGTSTAADAGSAAAAPKIAAMTPQKTFIPDISFSKRPTNTQRARGSKVQHLTAGSQERGDWSLRLPPIRFPLKDEGSERGSRLAVLRSLRSRLFAQSNFHSAIDEQY